MNPLLSRLALAIAAGMLAGALHAAEVTLKSAWMRPVPGGAELARAYVDIESTAALELVGASTPVARRVQIVVVHRIGDPTSEEVVTSLPVPAGGTTRLAYRGSHLRLVDVTRDLANGDPVPLTLMFKDAKGGEVRAATNVTVRGLLLPQQMPQSSRDAAPLPAAPAAQSPAPRAPEAPRM